MKRRITYIATREPEYSRVSIVREQLNRFYDVKEVLSSRTSYRLRLVTIALRVIWAWMTFRLRKSDAIVVGFFAQPIFPLVRMLYRGPIIADAYFSIYDTMVQDKKKVKPGSLVAKVCYWLDRHMLKRAELCFTDTNQHVEYMKQAFAVPDADIRRLWISAESQPLPQLAQAPKEGESMEVFFWGGFIPLQGVETIVRAAALTSDKNIHFTIFGDGQTMPACRQLQEKLHVTNIDFAGWKKSADIAEHSRKSHLALGIFGTTEKAARVIPNKVYEAMAMGLPFITRRSPAADELMEHGKNCLLVEPGNAEQLAEQILWARENDQQLRQIGTAGHELFNSTCSPSNVGDLMFAACESILPSPSSASVEASQPNPLPSTVSRKSPAGQRSTS